MKMCTPSPANPGLAPPHSGSPHPGRSSGLLGYHGDLLEVAGAADHAG